MDDASPLLQTLDRAIQGAKADAPALLATKDGQRRRRLRRAGRDRRDPRRRPARRRARARALQPVAGSSPWAAPAAGADGVVTSYREARDILDLADRLGIEEPVLAGRNLAVYRILLRDKRLLADLVDSTLGPLRTARGGAAPLVDTLLAYFALRRRRRAHAPARSTCRCAP